MKKIIISLVICLISFSLTSCGNKVQIDNSAVDNENKVNDNVKATTIAESYEKFATLKSDAYEMLSSKMEESNNYNLSLSMGLLGFSTLDLTLVPLTFCGLENDAAVMGLGFLYADVEYKSTNDSCNISFKTNEGKMSYVTNYDEKTDSVQTKMYENDKLVAISEYIRLDSGYATQFYSVDNDKASIYKSIFDNKKIIVGMQSNAKEPESIFKNLKLISEEWTKNQELWSKYENGKINSIYEGKEY